VSKAPPNTCRSSSCEPRHETNGLSMSIAFVVEPFFL
jgi:hypothetical protein